MKYLVTGGAGFIGSNLVDALLAEDNEVIVLDNLSTGRRENLNPKATFIEADITDLGAIKPAFAGVTGVFHVAALPRIPLSIAEPAKTNAANVDGTLNVLIAAKEAGVKRVVYSASSSAYGNQEKLPFTEDMPSNPLNPYGLQKYVGELYARLFVDIYGLETVVLRYFNVYGPRMATEGAYTTVIATFLRQKAAGEKLTICGDGGQTRDFTHVSDAVRANILAMKSEKVGHGEVLNIGAGANHSVNEIAKLVGGETEHCTPRPGEMRHTLADNSHARELLGWEPRVAFEEGIAALIE